MLCNENHDGLVVDGMIESEILWHLGFGVGRKVGRVSHLLN